MRKLLILIISITILTSCFGGNSWNEISKEDAKKELLNNVDNDNKELTKEDKDNLVKDLVKKDEAYVNIEYLTNNKFIEVKNILKQDTLKTIEIKWDVLPIVDKVIVNFENSDSKFPKDSYKLTGFKKGDKTFIYRAIHDVYNVLDYGLNEYVIEAHSEYEVSKIKVDIYIPKPEKVEEEVVVNNSDDTPAEVNVGSDEISYTEKKLFNGEEESLFVKFPEGSVFGDVLPLWNDKITYSKIDNFEIKVSGNKEVTCDDLTSFLKEQYSIFYWNTCRDLNGGGIKYNVLYVKSDKTYAYERHYYNHKNSIMGVVSLDKGTGIDLDNISSKNTEFKAVDYSRQTKVTDELFNLITKPQKEDE